MSPVATLFQRGLQPFLDGLSLRATGFAALIQQAGAEEMLGLARTEEVVPKAMRRRLSVYDMAAARCVAGLSAPAVDGKGADEDIVFASRYGNMAVTFDLLSQVVADELLSPAKFSVSVHNAAAGAASMVAKNRAGHTAVSALDRSAAAGLTETWTRLADGASSVIYIYSDIALMTPYAEFDEAGPSVTLAVRFSAGSPDGAHDLADGRIGAEAFARALAAGAGGRDMATLIEAKPAEPVSLLQTLERFVRLITTALSFALFGLGGLFFSIVVFPLLYLVVWDKQKRAAIAQACVHGLWRTFIQAMALMGTTSFEIDKPEVLRDLRGTIVIANHPSLLDVVYMMSFMRRTRAVVKAGVWRNPFMRGVVTAANYIPNLGDPERLMADCTAALKDGANLVIFPEGSRTPEGVLQRQYQKGFARVALAAGAPIQLVTIDVSPPMLRKGEPWHTVPKRRGHWTIRVHERIDVATVYGKEPTPAAVRRLSGDMAARIDGLLREGQKTRGQKARGQKTRDMQTE